MIEYEYVKGKQKIFLLLIQKMKKQKQKQKTIKKGCKINMKWVNYINGSDFSSLCQFVL